jgi:hypothetical protein
MGRQPNKKYRDVTVIITIRTVAADALLESTDEWNRVFCWMKPGDAVDY